MNEGMTESILRLERSSDFSWDEVGDGSGLTGSEFARAVTSVKDDSYWIYDHVPKTGGSEFNRLCEELLDPYDHLFVPWPGSWLGVTVGRAMRARIIHGHGARMAPLIMPWRQFRLAVNRR